MSFTCPHCHEPVESRADGTRWRFCPNCGGELAVVAPPGDKPPSAAAEESPAPKIQVPASPELVEAEAVPSFPQPETAIPSRIQLDTGGVSPRGPQVSAGYDPERDRRVKKRVSPAGAMVIAAALSGMVIPTVMTFFSLVSLSGATRINDIVLPLSVTLIGVLGLVWYSFVAYTGVLLRERKKPGLVTAGLVMLALGCLASIVTALEAWPCYVLHVLLALIAIIWAFSAMASMEVKLVMRDRTYGPRR